jgi:hypothetical protein
VGLLGAFHKSPHLKGPHMAFAFLSTECCGVGIKQKLRDLWPSGVAILYLVVPFN